jgi:glycosyltransferase involved in cell wall biosynthesis
MPARVLYIAPTFLADRTRKKIRGVQVFDLAFVVELARLGHTVVVPAEGSWRARLSEAFAPEAIVSSSDHSSASGPARGASTRQAPAGAIHVVYTPGLKKPLWAGLAAAWQLRGQPAFDATFIGNPARGIGPMLRLLRRRERGRWLGRVVLQANRPPRDGFAELLRGWPEVRIAAVSGYVRDGFPPDLRERVEVYYGIANAEAFFPGGANSSDAAPPSDDGLTHVCLIGKLDNAWKGADRALAAWRMLPADVRARARLHLASFADGRRIDESGVVVHPWMEPGAVPALLRRMHVMLVPSFGPEETFSQAMVQGMLSGLALITSDLPVLAEKLDAGGGVVCASDEALAHAIAKMVREPAYRQACGERARQIALERYVWDSAAFTRRFMGIE